VNTSKGGGTRGVIKQSGKGGSLSDSAATRKAVAGSLSALVDSRELQISMIPETYEETLNRGPVKHRRKRANKWTIPACREKGGSGSRKGMGPLKAKGEKLLEKVTGKIYRQQQRRK